MAGLGFKTFTAGEVLTAANLQGFAVDQSVMVFDNAAARTTALGDLVSEGMVTYLKDTNLISFFDGTEFVPVSNPGDITAVAAGYGLSGGGTEGDVTLATSTTLTDIGTATYTVANSDKGNFLRFTVASTVTIATTTAFSPGQQVQIFADGPTLAITAGAGVTLGGAGTSGTGLTFNLGAQFEAVSIFCVAADNYRVIGNVSVA